MLTDNLTASETRSSTLFKILIEANFRLECTGKKVSLSAYLSFVAADVIIGKDYSLNVRSGITTRVLHNIAIRWRRCARTLGRWSSGIHIVAPEMFQKIYSLIGDLQRFRT